MHIINVFREKNDWFEAIGQVLHYLESESLVNLDTYTALYRVSFSIMAT